MDTSSTVSPFFRHIPSLKAQAALAGQTLLDPDMRRDPDATRASNLARQRCSELLLTWLDDFYGDIADVDSYVSTDAAWTSPANRTTMPELNTPPSRDEIENFLHLLAHVDVRQLGRSFFLDDVTDNIEECTLYVSKFNNSCRQRF